MLSLCITSVRDKEVIIGKLGPYMSHTSEQSADLGSAHIHIKKANKIKKSHVNTVTLFHEWDSCVISCSKCLYDYLYQLFCLIMSAKWINKFIDLLISLSFFLVKDIWMKYCLKLSNYQMERLVHLGSVRFLKMFFVAC